MSEVYFSKELDIPTTDNINSLYKKYLQSKGINANSVGSKFDNLGLPNWFK